MSVRTSIRRAHSCAKSPREAARELYEGLAQPETALVIFFCSNQYDRAVLASELKRLFSGVQVVGCTTAGEIGPAGFREGSITGASFSADGFTAVAGLIEELHDFEVGRCHGFTQNLLQGLESRAPDAGPKNSFAFLLIDGLSEREEPVAGALQDALDQVPLIGGSAGDGLSFHGTHVYFEGGFHSDCAVLVLVTTTLPFRVFLTQHFLATDERLVVTDADAEHRIVREINGLPAVEEYARILGVDVRDLDPARFASSPVVVLIDGRNYVRSLRQANPDGSLTFFCAIEEGLVLRVAHGADFLANLEQSFTRLRAELGPPQLVLACDCIHRRLEALQHELTGRVGEIFQRNNTIGFSTYGEQFRGLHVNATLTGIAFGASASDEQDS